MFRFTASSHKACRRATFKARAEARHADQDATSWVTLDGAELEERGRRGEGGDNTKEEEHEAGFVSKCRHLARLEQLRLSYAHFAPANPDGPFEMKDHPCLARSPRNTVRAQTARSHPHYPAFAPLLSPFASHCSLAADVSRPSLATTVTSSALSRESSHGKT